MAKLRCDKISEGLRASEGLASFQDYRGRRHFLRVERDFLSEEGGYSYLPIGVVHVDPKTKLVLIELPHEAETGPTVYGSGQTSWMNLLRRLHDPVRS